LKSAFVRPSSKKKNVFAPGVAIDKEMAGKTKLGEAWLLLKDSAIAWWNDNTFRLAASLAYYTIFSLAPILLIAVGAASLFFTRATAVDQVVAEMQRLVGAQGASAIRQVLVSSAGLGKGAWAITVGVLTLLLGASVVFGELQSALNQIWGVKAEVRRGLILDYVLDRLRSFSIALGVGFLLLVSLVLSAALTALQDYLTNSMPALPGLWQTGNIVISFFVVAILFAMIYKYLPDVKLEWRHVWIGALVTSVLFNGGKYLISIYLGHAAIGSAFGAAGSFALLLVWIYYSALISFFGAEFTQVYACRHGRQIQAEAHARPVGRKDGSEPVKPTA
jgi:membrane protein